MDQHRRRILLVEDNPADVEFAREALSLAGADVDLDVASDGQEALDYLRAVLSGVAPRPDLMLLDLNLPRVGGVQVLEQLKADPEFRTLPIVVLSTSAAEVDVQGCYERHANGYLKKPASFLEFVELMKSFNDYWLESSHLPDCD